MRLHPFEHARRLASGTAATMGLLALLAIAPPADATVNTVSVSPPAPAPCDSVTITVSGNLPDNCFEIVGATIRGPEFLPCARPIPCPPRFVVEVTVREPNLAIERPCVLTSPYTRSFNVGKLPTGPYDVLAHERVIPFSPDSTDSMVSESFASGSFTVGPDSICTGTPGCFLLGVVPDLPDGRIPVDPPPCTASAPPGGTACLDLALTNSRVLGGLQVTLDISSPDSSASPDAILHPVSVDPVGRAAGFQAGWTADGSRTKLLLYSSSGASITPGYGPVVRICYSVAPGAVSQKFLVLPTAGIAADPAGDSIPPCPTFAMIPPGVICVGARTCDVNGDGVSDVLDIIRIVRCALGGGAGSDSIPACPDSIAARADCNGDGAVDIRDVICCVRKILGTLGLRAPTPFSVPAVGRTTQGNQIGFEGPIRWIDAVDGLATVRVDTAPDWGGSQFSVSPGGAGVRVRDMKLIAADTRDQLEWDVDGEGTARAILYTTAGTARAQAADRIQVSLERVASGAPQGTLRLGDVLAGTAAGLAAPVSTTNPSLDITGAPPRVPALLAARPNPTSGVTEVGFSLPTEARVTLRVYDIAGRLVRTLAEGPTTAGVHRTRWDGLDARGHAARSGIYFAKLEVGKTLQSERILLLR